MAYYQWRALIGPRYNHFDWTAYDYGPVSSTITTSLNRPLAAPVEPSDTTLTIDTADLPEYGGLFIAGTFGTNGEYVQYTSAVGSTVGGLVREPPAASNHNGNHEEDEIAYFWYPIDDDDGTLRFSQTMDNTLSVTTWEGEIRGYKARHWALRNNHVIIIQTRSDLSGPWTNQLIGVIDSPNFQDSPDRYGQWAIKIRSMESVWAQQRVKGVRIGNLDVAKGASASGSTALVLASDERGTGDYTASDPNFDASSAVDDDDKTLWIAERFIGTPTGYTQGNGDPENDGLIKFSQLYLYPPDDAGSGARWIELVVLSGNYTGVTLYSANGTEAAIWETSSETGDTPYTIVLTEDAAKFAELNPLATGVVKENAAWFQHLRAAGGDIWIKQVNTWGSRVAWGDGNNPGLNFPHEDAPDGDSNRYNHGHGDARLPAIGKGQTFRYLHDTTGTNDARDFWELGKVHHAGYAISNAPKQYVQVTLPGFGLFLAEDITSSVPGNNGYLKLVDAAGNGSTAGLANSGYLSIASEWIEYVSKDKNGVTLAAADARGANGTTATGHVAGDTVLAITGDLMSSFIISDAHMVKSLAWHHYGGTIHPQKFEVWVSGLRNPRSWGDENWQNDYASVEAEVAWSSGDWELVFDDPLRIKSLIIEIEEMTTDPARPRLNEIEAVLDPAYYLSSHWLANGVAAHTLIETVLVNAGMPASAISGSGTAVLSNVETAEDAAWTVVSDLAEFTGTRITVGRDSKITCTADPFWTASPSFTHTWDESNVSDVRKVDRNDLTVSQVRLPWRTPDDTDEGVAVYPETEGIIGQVLELDEQIFANEAAAEAAVPKKYYLAHFPFTVVVEAADSEPDIEPGEIHKLIWNFNRRDGSDSIERIYLVTGADHWIEEGHWYTTVYLQQIERVLGW